MTLEKQKFKRKAINLTIREDVIKMAKALNINTSKAAEDGIKKAMEEEWLKDNMQAIIASNERIETNGLLIKPLWLKE